MTFFPQEEINGFKFKVTKGKPRKRGIPLLKVADKIFAYLTKYERIPKSCMNAGKNRTKLYYQGTSILENLVQRDLAGDLNRLKTVINSFCKIQPDKYTPQIWSVYDFWMKFYQIEAFLERREEYVHQGKVAVEAQHIFNLLKNWHFSKYQKKVLPGCIEKSMENYRYLIHILKKINKKICINEHIAGYILEYHLGSSSQSDVFIIEWFTKIFEKVNEKKWESWKPDPRELVFSVESNKFYYLIKEMLYQTGPEPSDISRLVKEIQLENRKLRRQRGTKDSNRADRK